jgi:hypothetical protein
LFKNNDLQKKLFSYGQKKTGYFLTARFDIFKDCLTALPYFFWKTIVTPGCFMIILFPSIVP